MGKRAASSSVESQVKKRARKDKKPMPAPNLDDLNKTRDAGKKKHMFAEATDENYSGHVDRGLRFLSSLVTQKTASAESQEEGFFDRDVDTKEMAKAFNVVPNKYSAPMLELFLVQKCMTEKCSQSTAHGIHAAFIRFWDQSDGDKYRGAYSLDDDTGKVRGNPARAACIQDIMKTILNQCGSGGDTRTHATAISIQDMKSMMDWSYSQLGEEASSKLFTDVGELMDATKHILMRAFMSSGFTLWTRNFELCKLQFKDVLMWVKDDHGIWRHLVTLENRKGWQKAGIDGPLQSHQHGIYAQPTTPEIDMFSHLNKWITFMETNLLGRSLQPDDYIFPQISANGTIQPKGIGHDFVQKWIKEFADAAGLTGNYSTHCFRRGGAQYRFMYAPFGSRWSLAIIRWWGGWAEGERADTLIRYLVDTLASYENDHSDALCPIQREAEHSFNGDHTLVRPTTTAETREFKKSVDAQFQSVVTILTLFLTHAMTRDTAAPTASPVAAFVSAPTAAQSASQALPSPPPVFSSHSSQPPPAISLPSMGPQSKPPPSSKSTRVVPILGLRIPNLPQGPDAWRMAVKQWEEPDESTGKALKDWPAEWYTGAMKPVFAAKRKDRQIIAEEYQRFDCDDHKFAEAYPEVSINLKQLRKAIDKVRLERGDLVPRASKNGRPHERRTSGTRPSH